MAATSITTTPPRSPGTGITHLRRGFSGEVGADLRLRLLLTVLFEGQEKAP
jgi:hypothetical protein